MRSVNVFGTILFLSLSLLYVGCDKIVGCHEKEVSRIKSPDNKVDAVIMEKDCGVTVATNKSIYLTPAGKTLDGMTPVFVAYKSDVLDVKWATPTSLLIEYSNARILKFTNYWAIKELDNLEYEVKINEVKKN